MTDHESDLAPVQESSCLDLDSLELGGVTIHGTRSERRELFAALAKAQGAFTAVLKTADNPFFKSKYAPLENVLAAILPALSANGLFFSQPVVSTPDGKALLSKVSHAGGAVMCSSVLIPKVDKVQELGSAMTYLRRYTAQAMFGIAAETDDDGNAASGNAAPQEKQRKAPEPPKAVKHESAPPPPPADEPGDEMPAEMITEDQAKEIGQLFASLQFSKPAAQELCKKLTGRTGKDMTKAMANVVLAELRSRSQEEAS